MVLRGNDEELRRGSRCVDMLVCYVIKGPDFLTVR